MSFISKTFHHLKKKKKDKTDSQNTSTQHEEDSESTSSQEMDQFPNHANVTTEKNKPEKAKASSMPHVVVSPAVPASSAPYQGPTLPSLKEQLSRIPTPISSSPMLDPRRLAPINTNAHGLSLRNFEMNRTLGTGSFGRVHLVKLYGQTQFYAMKVLKKHKIVELKQVDHTINEKNILARIHHPFIVRLYCTFQDAVNLYMVMEYVLGGELFTILRRAQKFPNDIAKFYAAEVILAFEYLHSMNIVYRDLKPENILINKDGHVKLTDFGFAKYVPDVTRTLCGTPEYLAPEIIRSKDYGKPVDWYSLGILIFEMLAGYPPFYHENHVLLYEAVLEGQIFFPPHFDPWAVDLVRHLCAVDVSKRYGNLKNGVEDIKRHPWFAGVDWNKLYQCKIRPPYIPKVAGDGDTRHFEMYPEESEPYGLAAASAPDPYGDLFKNF